MDINIVILGAPGSGKGTQAKFLIKKYGLKHISTGELIRQEIAEGTEIGLKTQDQIAKGELVPDDVIIKLLEKHLEHIKSSNGVLFDGFPRNIVQAYMLEGLLSFLDTKVTCVIKLDVHRDELLRRIVSRGNSSGRIDDNLSVAHTRLAQYENLTYPLVDFYKQFNLLEIINGIGSVDDISGEIEKAVAKHVELQKTRIKTSI